MEVAGLVLSVFPIAVKAIQQFRDISSSRKDATRRLRSLERALEIELDIFKVTCELLLKDIVPSDQLKRMLDDPFGDDWKNPQFNRKLRLRLQDSYERIEKGAEEMSLLTVQFEKKIGIQEDLEVFAPFHLFDDLHSFYEAHICWTATRLWVVQGTL